MGTLDLTNEELVKLITRLVVQQLNTERTGIPIGVSNRHVHLDRADMDILFGPGTQLTKIKDLKQPGQFASEEVIAIKGPKGEFRKVRVLGPLRDETQVEISTSDSFALGVKAPLRESGKLEGTPGLELIGPAGSVKKDAGTIVALRHIHMTPPLAQELGLKDKELVCVEVGDERERGMILKNVLLRVSDKYALEMHLDVDEANAAGVKNGDLAKIIR